MSSFTDRMRFQRDHRWTPRHASEYLDGELSSRARLRLERHLGECEQCRRLLAGLRAVLSGLHHLAGPPPGDPQAIAAAVRRRLDEPGAG